MPVKGKSPINSSAESTESHSAVNDPGDKDSSPSEDISQ